MGTQLTGLVMKGIILNGVDAAVASLEKTIGYTSNFGKLWHISVAFRVMMTLLAGSSLYANHEATFKCATMQHLCADVCFNQFMPINYTRYWQVQTVFLGLVAFGFGWLIENDQNEQDLFEKLKKKSLDDEYSQNKFRKLEKKYVSNETYKMRMMDGKLTEISKRISLFHFIHLLLLAAVDLVFLISLAFLLKQQHDPQQSMAQLLRSTDIVYTPPIYICNIEKTFTSEQKDLYDTDAAFRKTLTGLRVKAEMSCDQTDSACTVSKYYEKTCILCAMLAANVFGVVILFVEILGKTAKVLKPTNQVDDPEMTQKCNNDVLLMPTNNMP